jgi:hypothetical protein
MWKDEIVEETWRKRDAYAAKFNYDLEAIYHDLKAREQQSGRQTVSLSPKQPLRFAIQKPVKAVAA